MLTESSNFTVLETTRPVQGQAAVAPQRQPRRRQPLAEQLIPDAKVQLSRRHKPRHRAGQIYDKLALPQGNRPGRPVESRRAKNHQQFKSDESS